MMTKKQFRELRLVALIAMLAIAVMTLMYGIPSAEAGSRYSAPRITKTFKPSTYKATPKVQPSKSYAAPKPNVRTVTPPPKQPQKVIVNRNTTVHQTVVQRINPQSSAPVSSGGGFMSGFLGAAGGAALTNWIMSPDEPAPQAQPVQEAPQQAVQQPIEQPQPNPQGCIWDAAGQFFKCPAQVAPQ